VAGGTAVFHIVPALYLAIKLLGAGYLIWFGAAMIRHALNKKSDLPEVGQTPQKTGQRAFIESVTVEVLNPKTALFFLAFLPQFVDASAAYPLWLQFLILGSIGNLMFLSADLIFIWFAGIIINRLRQSDGLSKALEILGGSIIVVLGLSLLTQHSEI